MPEIKDNKEERWYIGGAAKTKEKRKGKEEFVGAPSTSYNKACDLLRSVSHRSQEVSKTQVIGNIVDGSKN